MPASAPLGSPSRNTGRVEADWTSATQIGLVVSVVIVQAAATSLIHMHRLAVSQVLQSRRNTGTPSGWSAVNERIAGLPGGDGAGSGGSDAIGDAVSSSDAPAPERAAARKATAVPAFRLCGRPRGGEAEDQDQVVGRHVDATLEQQSCALGFDGDLRQPAQAPGRVARAQVGVECQIAGC